MKLFELLNEMAGAVDRKDSDHPYLNVGPGKLGLVLFNTGDAGWSPSSHTQRFYQTAQDLAKAIKDFESSTSSKINWTNPNDLQKSRAFAWVKLRNEQGQEFYVGKLMMNTEGMYKFMHDPTDRDPKRFDTSALEKLGYAYSFGSSLKRRGKEHLKSLYQKAMRTKNWDEYKAAISGQAPAGQAPVQNKATPAEKLQPSVLLSPLVNLTSQSIVEQVRQKLPNNPDVVELTEKVAAGQQAPFAIPQSIGKASFTVDFCEILQPLSIVAGSTDIGIPIDPSSTISFHEGASGSLFDSFIKSGENTIYISSKQGKGTRSSLGAVENNLDKLTPEERNKYKTQLEILDIIFKSPAQPSPGNLGVLSLGIKLGFLDKQSAEYISKLDPSSPIHYQRIHGKTMALPPDAPQFVKNILASSKPAKSGPSPFYQSVYAVMKMATDKINSDKNMNDMLNLVFSRKNLVFISTQQSGTGVQFIKRSADINLSLGESYHKDHIKKKLAFEVT